MSVARPLTAILANHASSSSSNHEYPEAGPSTFTDLKENTSPEPGPSTDRNATFPFDYPGADSADDVTSGSESELNGNGKRRRSNKGKETNFSRINVPELENPDLPSRRPSQEISAPFVDPYAINPQYISKPLTNSSNTRSTVMHHVLKVPQRTGGQVLLSLDVSHIVKYGVLPGATATVTSFISVNDFAEPRLATMGHTTDAAFGVSAEAASTTLGLKSPDELMRLPPSERIKAIKVNESITKAIAKASSTKVAKKKPAGFCDLPLELRTSIYNLVFVAKGPIDFQSRERFANSGQFLRTCRMVHDEGKSFLYGENVFHFERSHERRGQYFSHVWEEVGWKDVRSFLETIGPDNLALLKRISLVLSDSFPSNTPTLDPEWRRFVHQATVHHCLNIIGHRATSLEKVSLCISGRRILEVTDIQLIRALKSIRADAVHSSGSQRHRVHSNIRSRLLSNILNAMTKPANRTGGHANHAVRMYCEVGGCQDCVSS